MKTELEHLNQLKYLILTPATKRSDILKLVHKRILDLHKGYTDDDVKEFEIISRQVECPDCHNHFKSDAITNHGCCEVCLDRRAEKFTKKFLEVDALGELTMKIIAEIN